MKAGRKSQYEEIDIKRRYSDLSEKFFDVLKENLNSEVKSDKKWAVEQLSKAYPKMIPQQVDNKLSGGITIKIDKEIADKYDTPQNPKDNS